MNKPTKTEAELVALARAELNDHQYACSSGIAISVLRKDHGWEFRTMADAATTLMPGYPECVAVIVQIGDHLSRQYDVSG